MTPALHYNVNLLHIALVFRTEDGGRELGNDLAQFRCQAIKTHQCLLDLAQERVPLLRMAKRGPGFPLAWTGLAGLAQTLAPAAFLIAKLPLDNSLPTVMFCNVLLSAFHCPAKVHIIKSEIKVIGVLFGLLSLHLFLVTDLLSGLEHHQPKKTWSTVVLWVLHLVDVAINQCLNAANRHKHKKKADNLQIIVRH